MGDIARTQEAFAQARQHALLKDRVAELERMVTDLRTGQQSPPTVNSLTIDTSIVHAGDLLPLRDIIDVGVVEVEGGSPRKGLGIRADAFVKVPDSEFMARLHFATISGKAYPYVTAFKAVVDTVQNDWLTGRFVDPATGSATGAVGSLLIGRPNLHQRTPYDNETITYVGGQQISYVYSSPYERVATGVSPVVAPEAQVITPAYIIGDKITIAPVITGLTSGGARIVWEDKNDDGRCWTEVLS